jgi:hypothetical protein
MSLLLKSRIWRFMSAGSLGTLIIATFLPIWTIRHGNEPQWIRHDSLWTVIYEVKRPKASNLYVPATADENDVIIAMAIVFAGCALGAAIYAMARRVRTTTR